MRYPFKSRDGMGRGLTISLKASRTSTLHQSVLILEYEIRIVLV